MNKVEELLMKARKEDFEKKEEAVVPSAALGKALHMEGPIDVLIEEISQRKVSDIMAMQINEKGRFDKTKVFDAQLMLIVEGVKDPSPKSKDLLEHFGKATPKELAEFLFKSDIGRLYEEIGKLCGIETGVEDEIKN
ncbi:hypothetical protein NE619_13130 [Anaerovorax odorimutans]|uniref:XkdN-like protein n=1 Tax=Anaerovorax odorimutans TaxID=109327 RepID=A0ABT1RR56_9FIRM|nr:hypothetical protein [Anaerovorax odorimutans]MCQ4637670.1 hypothetical protein [Anaerovorax odorimutans]